MGGFFAGVVVGFSLIVWFLFLDSGLLGCSVTGLILISGLGLVGWFDCCLGWLFTASILWVFGLVSLCLGISLLLLWVFWFGLL